MTDTQTKAVNPCRVMATNVRLAFCHLFKAAPRAQGSEDLRFQTVLLVPPTADLKIYSSAIQAAMIKKFSKLIPLKGEKANPIRACQEEYAGFAKGWMRINATSERQPPVVNAARLPITNPSDVHAGQWANVILLAYGWGPNIGGSGVSFELEAVQILRDGADTDPDGPRLDGRAKRVNPDEFFEALELPAGDQAGFDPLAGLQ